VVVVVYNLEYYQRKYFAKDLPIPYKLKCGYELTLYPILVNQWDLFEECLDIVLIDKNSINDANIISMSYLEFLKEIRFNIKEEIEKGYFFGDNELNKLKQFFHICLKEDYISIEKAQNKYLVIIGGLDEENDLVLKATMTNKEFQEVVKIILFQNIKDYDDRKLDPEVQKIYNDYISLKQRDIHQPTFEEKLNYVLGITGKNVEEINNMTYRRFDGIFDSMVNRDEYIATKIIEASEKFKCDKTSIYFLYQKKKDKYADFIQDPQNLKNKIDGVNNN
jgi:hypothetical protein